MTTRGGDGLPGAEIPYMLADTPEEFARVRALAVRPEPTGTWVVDYAQRMGTALTEAAPRFEAFSVSIELANVNTELLELIFGGDLRAERAAVESWENEGGALCTS